MPLYDGITTRLLDDYQTQLVIEKISSRHNGDYTCLASNSAATRSYTATLTVNGKAPAAGAAGGGARGGPWEEGTKGACPQGLGPAMGTRDGESPARRRLRDSETFGFSC